MAHLTFCDFCDSSDTYIYHVSGLKHCFRCHASSSVHPVTTVSYDAEYVARRYDQYPLNDAMSRLRLSLIEDLLYLCRETWSWKDRKIARQALLDVGYGNGSFIREAILHGWEAVGCDVNPTEYPGVRRVELPLQPDADHYFVTCFYDSLEHFPDVRLLKPLVRKTEWIIVSAPKAPQPALIPEWKHYRPGEHHHYLTPLALEKLFRMPDRRSEIRFIDYPEDRIRGKLDGKDNIFTVALRCCDE